MFKVIGDDALSDIYCLLGIINGIAVCQDNEDFKEALIGCVKSIREILDDT